MPRIIRSDHEIYTRNSEISEMLRPLFALKGKSGPACKHIPGGNNKLIFAAHQGNPSEDFQKWRFNLYRSGYRAGYYEIWQPINPQKLDSYFLIKAYLTIFKFSDEFLCLHCDPEEPQIEGNNSHIYKQLPHLHIIKSDNPLPKSHIAIGCGFIGEILSSDKELFNAISTAIGLVCDEILDRLKEESRKSDFDFRP